MKKISVLLCVLILSSCEYFNVKKTSSEAILKEELQTFNWNEVDAYPSFSDCDSSLTKLAGKLCFERVLRRHIMTSLQQEIIIVTQDIRDTIYLEFLLSEKGDLTLQKVEVDSLTVAEIPSIKELLNNSLDSLPKIFPATKRGQQVKTEFKLPIIINVK
ncbi:hypothetical protein [Hyunsoonleella aestuarii]|uniref:TonB C-terminal domain-containing protein n=1 Tax=Hyunsoonleella aestuarii TaxID=912802 RepID=A0ABP8E8I1_9FLAO|nr:hypothetical protein [Hyunsoonleella aestuarii]